MIRRAPLRRSSLVLLVAFALSCTVGCEDSASSGTSSGDAATGGFDGGGGGGTPEGGNPPPSPPPGSANSILGLSSKGSIVRIGLAADGIEEDLGFPKYQGQELRGIRAIAAGNGGLYGLDPGSKSGASLVRISVTGLVVTPVDPANDFRARVPEKEGLAFAANKVFGSGQFGPVVELGLDGTLVEYILRQGNDETDDTQCTTPEDLVFYGGVLAAGTCQGTNPAKTGYWVWEYIFGKPGTSGQGGTLTNKALRFQSPERIVGIGVGGGGLVAVSAQNNLLSLQGGRFAVVRKLGTTIIDLE